MATPAQRHPLNVRMTLQKYLQSQVQTPNTSPTGRAYASGWCDWGDAEYDNSGHNYWARFDVVDEAAGSFDRTMFQVTCFSRQSADPLGRELHFMVDLFMAALRSGEGLVQMYDYRTTPAAPTIISGRRLRVVNSDGRFGEPEGGVSLAEAPNGVDAKVVTWLCRVEPDDLPSDRYRGDL